jgi:hypothetical protein
MGGIRAQLLMAATAGVYFGLNTVLNVTNRWLLGVKGFSFPATLRIMLRGDPPSCCVFHSRVTDRAAGRVPDEKLVTVFPFSIFQM